MKMKEKRQFIGCMHFMINIQLILWDYTALTFLPGECGVL